MKRPALQNKQVRVLRMAFQAWKVFRLEKQASETLVDELRWEGSIMHSILFMAQT